MKLVFLKSFSKDLDTLKNKSAKIALTKIIEHMETAETLEAIPNTKKLKGHKAAYRTRVGNFRLGYFYENSTITLARFIHRKDIYKNFP